ncbi:hypothetical protein GPECTOR_1g494 [Gonium pectorale]|uniref:sn-1-specific diacylglycerol lipase n=1 Tax=Gonium pectorale TaxID=33097 RepID=A0A150H4N5_GONPE|nr:hypothetical protein GPECTOR_1g494 [Gonium pectorale]|eukprot:KXZ56550.1 hypothetical protein GPECTOR_1g494 [Gonium pectorale]
MPALHLLGRRLLIASDDVPLFALPAALFHSCWALVLLCTLALYQRHSLCRDEGDYLPFLGGAAAAFSVSSLLEWSLCREGLKGTPLETDARAAVPLLLYLHGLASAAEVAFACYGAYLLHVHHRLCLAWSPRPLAAALVGTSWAVIAINGALTALALNPWHGLDLVAAWEARLLWLARLLCCRAGLLTQAARAPDRDPALRRIAALTSRLLQHVDLTLSDVAAAMMLVAAAQRPLLPRPAASAAGPPAVSFAPAPSHAVTLLHPMVHITPAGMEEHLEELAGELAAEAAEAEADAEEYREGGGEGGGDGGAARTAGRLAPWQLSEGAAGGLDLDLERGPSGVAQEPGAATGDAGGGGRAMPVAVAAAPEAAAAAAAVVAVVGAAGGTGAMSQGPTAATAAATALRQRIGDAALAAAFAAAREMVDRETLTEAEVYCREVTSGSGSNGGGQRMGVSGAGTADSGGGSVKAAPRRGWWRGRPSGPDPMLSAIRAATVACCTPHVLHVNTVNSTEGYLPYMVCLDEGTRSVVIAIRGTSSAEDIVTDCLCAPYDVRHLLPPGVLPERGAPAAGGAESGSGGAGAAAAQAAATGAGGSGGDQSPAGDEAVLVHGGIWAAAEVIWEDLCRLKVLDALFPPPDPNATGTGTSSNPLPMHAAPAAGPACSAPDDAGTHPTQRLTQPQPAVVLSPRLGDTAGPSPPRPVANPWDTHRPTQRLTACPPPLHAPTTPTTSGEISMQGNSLSNSAGNHSDNSSAHGRPGPANWPRLISAEREQAASQQPGLGAGLSRLGSLLTPPQPSPSPPTLRPPGLDLTGWRVVVTGHSLGGGAAALLAMRLRAALPAAVNVRCWAFSPPGSLASPRLSCALSPFTVSVVSGKDLIPRLSLHTLERYRDEMITALARCSCSKAALLLIGLSRRHRLRRAARLLLPYAGMGPQAVAALREYHAAVRCVGRLPELHPPGRILYLQPSATASPGRLPATPSTTAVPSGSPGAAVRPAAAPGPSAAPRVRPVWVSSVELLSEGILASTRMLADHSLTGATLPALQQLLSA